MQVEDWLTSMIQAQRQIDTLNDSAAELDNAIRDAEKDIFSDFCQSVGITNIQEYEDKQFRQAQEEAEAELKYNTQISRLEHQ